MQCGNEFKQTSKEKPQWLQLCLDTTKRHTFTLHCPSSLCSSFCFCHSFGDYKPSLSHGLIDHIINSLWHCVLFVVFVARKDLVK